MNDFDRFGDVEDVDGLLPKLIGDGGHGVGLFDRVFGDAEVRAVDADQGDVGSVEGGDEGERAFALSGHDAAGEHRGDGVGNRIVDVEQVEVVFLGDFRHAGGESQAVRRVLEERVVRDFDLVIDDIRAVVEADRVGVGDEVDLVAAVGEFESEFGGDDSAASVGWVASDADSHARECSKMGV